MWKFPLPYNLLMVTLVTLLNYQDCTILFGLLTYFEIRFADQGKTSSPWWYLGTDGVTAFNPYADGNS